MASVPDTDEYRCPGDRGPISRAVHLGRLARFYPACRGCRYRKDRGFVPEPRARRVAEFLARDQRGPQFSPDGILCRSPSDLPLPVARRIGAVFGVVLRRRGPAGTGRPAVAVACDGRAVTAPLVAAVSEGLRWSGAAAVDVGRATAGLVVRAVAELGLDGGLLVGGAGGETGSIGIKYWYESGRPLDPESLDRMAALGASGVDRPVRKCGRLERIPAEGPYLAELAESYHGLRPLRTLLRSDCPAAADQLEQLARGTACRLLAARGAPGRMGRQIQRERAHGGVQIQHDGETCQVFDDRGQPVPGDRLLLLLAAWVVRRQPGPIVAEEGTRPGVLRHLDRLGEAVTTSRPERLAMFQAMEDHGTQIGGGPSGRFWYRGPGGWIAADAVRTVTHLLQILSQSDRPFSKVLDAEAPVD